MTIEKLQAAKTLEGAIDSMSAKLAGIDKIKKLMQENQFGQMQVVFYDHHYTDRNSINITVHDSETATEILETMAAMYRKFLDEYKQAFGKL